MRSRFFTMDVAKRRDGDWLIVELGDGQVAGLPEHADVDGFYKALRSNNGVVEGQVPEAGRRLTCPSMTPARRETIRAGPLF